MLQRFHGATILGAVALAAAVFACTAGTVGGSSGSSGSTQPQTQAQVTSTSGLVVTASISAATLGEECGGTSGSLRAPAGDCAPSADGGTCGGPSFCQQSNVQMALTASSGSKAATIEVVSVTLHDSATGDLVDTLTASKPQAWSGSSYAPWDETIGPGAQLKASYDLTAPKWSTITNAKTTSAYSTRYKLHVTLRIDGVEVVLQSTDLNREPQVAT